MNLKQFIVKALSEIDGTQLQGGTVHMDIVVWPSMTGIEVVSPKGANEGLSRISFDIKISEKTNSEDQVYE